MDLLKATRRVVIKSWLKHVCENTVLLWGLQGFFEVRLKCIDTAMLENLKCGSLVLIKGSLVGENEICVDEFRVLHEPVVEEELCRSGLPSDPVEYTLKYYEYVKHPQILKAIYVYSYLLNYARSFLNKHGFLELPPPIIGYSSDPGLRGARKVQIGMYNGFFELQSSLIMYKQLYASVLDKIFYVARNVRIEPPENAYTGRHLVEFTQIDVEIASVSSSKALNLAEKTLYSAVRSVINELQDLFDYNEIDRLEKEITKPPYPRLTYNDALHELSKMGVYVKHGEELPFKAEALIADKYGSPVWIAGFPVTARGFYYIENPEHPGYNEDYNLLLPSGHGEVIDGGCREYRYENLSRKIAEIHREPLEKYSWFLNLALKGLIRPTCGWGLGLERLVKYLLNLKHIAYTTPHPRLPGIIGP